MITAIDYVLDRITMYRLVLYILIGLLGIAAILAYVNLLPFSPLALLASSLFLVIMCWAMNTILAYVFEVPTNIESATITALILALIIDPVQSAGDFQFLGWAAILAMSSKYILALYKKHLFNPAAIAVVITSFVLGESASWWIGTASYVASRLVGRVAACPKTTSRRYGLEFLCCRAGECLCAYPRARKQCFYRTGSIVSPVATLFLCDYYVD